MMKEELQEKGRGARKKKRKEGSGVKMEKA